MKKFSANPKINRRDFLKILGLSTGALLGLPQLTHTESNSKLPNILIVVFDALSATNMSLYGYIRNTSPHLERLAERAYVFHKHYAAGNFTTPGTASLLTGVYPWSHRALNLLGTVDKSFENRSIFNQLPEDYSTFAYTHNPLVNFLLDQFQSDIDQWIQTSEFCLRSSYYADFFRNDHRVAYDAELTAFGNSHIPSSILLSLFDQLLRNFYKQDIEKKYSAQFPMGVPKNFHEDRLEFLYFTLEGAIEGLTQHIKRQHLPFMGYIHLWPPHQPYYTRKDFIDIFDDSWQPDPKPTHHFTWGHNDNYLAIERKKYDEYVAYIDSEFARLYEHLEKNRLLENTLLIFTSDHGELFERGIFSHITPVLYEPLIRIPLLIWMPGQTQRRDIYSLTSCADILPTLAYLTDQPMPAWNEGSILPVFDGIKIDEHRSVFAVEAKDNNSHLPLRIATLALLEKQYKLIYYLGYDGFTNQFELYDLQNDPEELNNIYDPQNEIASRMRAKLLQKLEQVNESYQ